MRDASASLGEELARIRTSAGLSQAELAERAGLKQSNVARIENGSSIPRVDTLQRILAPLGYHLAITEK